MAITQYTDAVEIDGSQDVTQLTVQGHSTQDEALQSWQDSAGGEHARLTGDGRLQIGSIENGMMATDDALIEAHRDEDDTAMPKRGQHLLGRVTDDLTSVLHWVVQELELLGLNGVSALHTALRAKLTNKSTGASNLADLRAGDFEAVNEGGSSSNPVGELVGVHATATTQNGGYTNNAVGVDVEVNESSADVSNAYGIRVNDITGADDNYAIHTGSGLVHLGDVLEIPVEGSTPADNPPSSFLKVYPMLSEGVPQLYGLDSSGMEHQLGGSSSSTPSSSMEFWTWNDGDDVSMFSVYSGRLTIDAVNNHLNGASNSFGFYIATGQFEGFIAGIRVYHEGTGSGVATFRSYFNTTLIEEEQHSYQYETGKYTHPARDTRYGNKVMAYVPTSGTTTPQITKIEVAYIPINFPE